MLCSEFDKITESQKATVEMGTSCELYNEPMD